MVGCPMFMKEYYNIHTTQRDMPTVYQNLNLFSIEIEKKNFKICVELQSMFSM
jgi:hypothetical protein